MINSRLQVWFKKDLLKVAVILAALYGIFAMSDISVHAATGDTHVHDPSMIKAADDCYYTFSTGGTLYIRKSCTMTSDWNVVTSVFHDGTPRWIHTVIDSQPIDLWAPNINFFNDKYYLYYAGSTFGSNKSVIGLATAKEITGPWTDEGEVLHSVKTDNYNAIDPYLAWDADGQAWLAFGSWWDGIKMRQIDPKTGKLLESNSTLYSLASRGGGAIEAPAILHVDDYYYLFVSFDKCCAGIQSTYRIMVGRSKSITGPYLDKTDKEMMKGGGTQLLATDGQYIGPGGQEVESDNKTNRLVYHYYDGKESGKSKLAISEITFDSDGWPVLKSVFK